MLNYQRVSSCFPQDCYLGPISHGFDGQASSQRSEHRGTEITESESTKLTWAASRWWSFWVNGNHSPNQVLSQSEFWPTAVFLKIEGTPIKSNAVSSYFHCKPNFRHTHKKYILLYFHDMYHSILIISLQPSLGIPISTGTIAGLVSYIPIIIPYITSHYMPTKPLHSLVQLPFLMDMNFLVHPNLAFPDQVTRVLPEDAAGQSAEKSGPNMTWPTHQIDTMGLRPK